MIIPYSTDAPIYHYPIATIGAIAVNTVASFVGWSSGADWMSDWILRFGEFNPAQWITNTFLHADIVHLIGNMIFLWTFGLIVEGKIGWWKFSIFYLSIAAMEGSFVQAVMFLIPTDSVGALGASGVITGLAATSLLWAPKNGINCLYAFFIGHFRQYSSGTVAVPVALFVVLLLVKDLAYAIIADFEMSSAMLHIIGGVAGGAAGWAMLVTGRVDCEQWDILSIIRNGGAPAADLDELRGAARDEELANVSAAPQKRVDTDLARSEFLRLVDEGQLDFAWQAYLTLKQRNPDWRLPGEDLLKLATAQHERLEWSASVPVLVEYLRHETQTAPLVRLKLAHILLEVENRPSRALAALEPIDPRTLPPDKQTLLRALRETAGGQQDDSYELKEDW